MTTAVMFTAIALPSFIGLLLVWERVAPNHPLPRSVGWRSRVLVVYLLQLGVMLLGEITWNAVFRGASFLSLEQYVNPWLGGFLAYFIWSGLNYGWHRWRHENRTLWRIFHQLHHSPQRLESLTALFLHPFDFASHALLGSFVVYVLLGLGREAALLFFAYSTMAGFFYHSNIRVPGWIGYIVQTPDMHRVHHEYGKHTSNYADFVCWDMLFGTYRRPTEPIVRCGFDAQKERRFLAMLGMKDVHSET